MITVLVADDHGVVREGVFRVLEREPDIEVCAEAVDGEEALLQLERHRPDILLLDVTMPRLSGLETLERVKARHPGVKTLLLSFRADAPLVESALSLGVDGYLLKNARGSEIPTAIREVMQGRSYFSAPVAREIAARERRPRSSEAGRQLSPREREVLRSVAEGHSAREIAASLGISSKTVEAHRASVMRKLGLRKSTELVRWAVRNGLIEA